MAFIVPTNNKMKFLPENKCRFCFKLFCCEKCRAKHETDVHSSLLCELGNCDLCNGQDKIVLQHRNTNEFIDHLFKFHLPLQCGNCAVVFQNKVDLVTVHTCVSSEKVENEKLNSKMALEGEGKIGPIIEEDLEQEKVAENSKPYDGSVAENGSLIRSDNSENSNRTPLNNLVRQTSTPMTTLLHERHAKGHSYDSMSASSIQMSSIESCSRYSCVHDISPPVPPSTSNSNVLKQPNRRMPVGVTPYRHLMSKSIQRAISSQGISRYRCVESTPPLDLRTSPVIRRTNSMEGNGKLRSSGLRNDGNMIDLRTTPVIRRTRQIEAKNLATAINARPDGLNGTLNDSEQKTNDQNNKNSTQESLQKSSLSRSKSSNTFFETCRSFETSVTSSDQIAETPKTSGISKRNLSFANRHTKVSDENKEQWFTPSPENDENKPAGSTKKAFVDNSSELTKEDEFKEGDTNSNNKNDDKDLTNQSSKGILWSLFSSVLRLTSTGGQPDVPSNDNNSLIKRCASFTGILPKKPLIHLNDDNPYKRRRTTTISEVESYSQQLDEDGNDSGKRIQRIHCRPPIDRMRQS